MEKKMTISINTVIKKCVTLFAIGSHFLDTSACKLPWRLYKITTYKKVTQKSLINMTVAPRRESYRIWSAPFGTNCDTRRQTNKVSHLAFTQLRRIMFNFPDCSTV